MELIALALPATAAKLDRNHIKVSSICRLVDGNPHLRRLALAYAKPTSLVANSYKSIKTSHLAGISLLLDNTDMNHLALDIWQKVLDDLCLLYPHAVFVNLIHGVYLACQHHASKRSSGFPF